MIVGHASSACEELTPAYPVARNGLFVGDAAIVIRCIETWTRRGHRCLGVVTADAHCAEWAACNGIATHFSRPSIRLTEYDLLQLTQGKPIDILWSIHNIRVLSTEVLALAREASINYHDALLPSYAGLHAPSWAILAREPRHGITWHQMVEMLDAGDILEQEDFTVTDDDTAWTLGLRCVEAAECAFSRILDHLESGCLVGRPQSSIGRSYFSAYQKPTPGCVIDWRRSAQEIDALTRALDFGPAENPLGLPKALTFRGALAIRRLSVSDHHSDQAPGTITARPRGSNSDRWRIATSTFDVEVLSWTNLDGTPVSSDNLEAFAIRDGELFLSEIPAVAAFQTLERLAHRFEATWRNRLEHLQPLAPPGFETTASGGEVVVRLLTLAANHTGEPDAELLRVLTALAEDVTEPFDIAFTEIGRFSVVAAAAMLHEPAPPLRIEPVIAAMRHQLAAHRSMPPFRRDLVGCSRRLREQAAERRCLVEVRVGSEPIDVPASWPPPGSESRQLIVHIRDGSVEFVTASERAAQLGCLVERLRKRLDAGLSTSPPEALQPNVIETFLAQAKARPSAVAILDGCTGRTYGDLARRAITLGEAIRRREIGPGDVVAVRVTQLFDLVTALLGIGVSGAAFWAIDVSERETRIAQLCREARPCALVTDDPAAFNSVRASLPQGIIPIGVADGRELPALHPNEPARPNSLAYLAFTSGSTGFPKAVAIEHASLARYIEWFGCHCALDGQDRMLQVGSPAFDLAYEQIFATLTRGATLVEAPRPLGSAREIWRHIAEQSVTVLDLPTGLWHQIAPVLATNPELWPGKIRVLYLGGEAARSETLAVLRQVVSADFRCVNTYGPTEATIVATALEVRLDSLAEPASVVPIGRPVAGAIAEICSANGELSPKGEIGELWLGGPGLARGYYGHPEITSRAFVATARGRRYRTGDRVSMDSQGCLHFLGRLDRQVKIAGRRVALEEIETALCGIPGIREAVVLASSSEHLCSWLELAPGVVLADVTATISKLLPPALRPRRYEIVASLPRTPSGKPDYAAFSFVQAVPGLHAASPNELADPTLLKLAVCWRRALGFTPATADDDFFVLGGDSLAAITLLAEIEGEFHVTLPVANLLREPTLRGLAQHMVPSKGNQAICPPQARSPSNRSSGIAAMRKDGVSSSDKSLSRVVPGRGQTTFAEQEDFLNSHPAIEECCVVLRDIGNGEIVPVAFITLKHHQTVRGAELVFLIARRFPGQTVTDKFIGLSKLPRTSDNLIDRVKLAEIPLPDFRFRPPRDIVEIMIAKVWQELLGINNIGIKDNFFDSGGDSLRAIEMVARLETELGVRLPLAALFEKATIAAIAQELRDIAASNDGSPLIKIQNGGLKRPLLFLHGDFTGGGLHCLKLARQIDYDLSFYAVQPFGLPGQPIPSSIEKMSEEYLAHIIALDPEGPYRLAGHCIGALIAMEIAQRLLAKGKHIELLIMIDPPPPRVSRFSGKEPDTFVPFCDKLELNSFTDDVRRNILFELYRKTLAEYAPKFFHGNLTLFLAGSTTKILKNKASGWDSFAENTDIHIIPGEHLSIFTHNIEQLAMHIRACLTKVNNHEG